MRELLPRYRWAVEPAVGALFLSLWALGSVNGIFHAAAVFFAAGIAVSRLSPAGALLMGWIGVFTALPTGPTLAWGIALVAVPLILFGNAAYGRPITKRLGLFSALAGSVLVGLVAVFMTGVGLAFGGGAVMGLAAFGLVTAGAGLVSFVPWSLGQLAMRRRGLAAPGDAELAEFLMPPLTAAEFETEQGLLIRPMSRRQLVVDIVLATVFVALFETGLLGFFGGVSALVLIAYAFALALRRLSPQLALTVAWVASFVSLAAFDGTSLVTIAVLPVLYATARYGGAVTRWAGLVSAVVGAVIATVHLTSWPYLPSGGILALGVDLAPFILSTILLLVGCLAVLGLSWVLGLLTRTWDLARESRRAQTQAEQDEQRAQRTVVVEQERNRIARDMHDVVAHSLAVVIAQADGARYAKDANPEVLDGALATIATTARAALVDVRVLLAQLRHDGSEGPQPTLADVDELVERTRRAGLDVALTGRGVPGRLGAAQQLAAYRIVQEALTNVLRHGDAERRVEVVFDWREHELIVLVTNLLDAPLADELYDPLAAVSGHGLPGMRERAVLVGGSFAAHRLRDRFVVEAHIPVLAREHDEMPDDEPVVASEGADADADTEAETDAGVNPDADVESDADDPPRDTLVLREADAERGDAEHSDTRAGDTRSSDVQENSRT
ncbi:sensor histidine kinase [Compostimonas suwonensis]|uniref:histidine kinase n=1 Tax=Compostimonas suwonensis TaxID=1048394 RepID=A0A2M9BZ48_9MICO|nr:histidine kinase [Compostimonas suwonensis]PJJ63354.1 signal transduction histidine kinase [Compostimonas suwonensis]